MNNIMVGKKSGEMYQIVYEFERSVFKFSFLYTFKGLKIL